MRETYLSILILIPIVFYLPFAFIYLVSFVFILFLNSFYFWFPVRTYPHPVLGRCSMFRRALERQPQCRLMLRRCLNVRYNCGKCIQVFFCITKKAQTPFILKVLDINIKTSIFQNHLLDATLNVSCVDFRFAGALGGGISSAPSVRFLARIAITRW